MHFLSPRPNDPGDPQDVNPGQIEQTDGLQMRTGNTAVQDSEGETAAESALWTRNRQMPLLTDSEGGARALLTQDNVGERMAVPRSPRSPWDASRQVRLLGFTQGRIQERGHCREKADLLREMHTP